MFVKYDKKYQSFDTYRLVWSINESIYGLIWYL